MFSTACHQEHRIELAAIFGSIGLTGTKSLDRLPDGAGFITLLMLDGVIWFPYPLCVDNALDTFHLILPGGMGILVSRVSFRQFCFILLKQRFQVEHTMIKSRFSNLA